MQALLETTDWGKEQTPNHTYLVDGTNLIAYIRSGTSEPYYFKQPIKGFSKSGRKFKEVKPSPFETVEVVQDPCIIQVEGSKGQVYSVNIEEKTCTCPGFTFRGKCKHVETALNDQGTNG